MVAVPDRGLVLGKVDRVEPLRIFIGYDAREAVAFSVLAHSILRRASRPVSIVPLVKTALEHQGVYTRPRAATESTDFSLTRFLVPHLCDYRGLAVFMDCDMVCRADISEVLLHVATQPYKAVYVCQHEYEPRDAVKFQGHVQTRYPRKNWSSFMVFDCGRCTALTPSYVNTATGLELHRFAWTTDDAIGALPLEWNWLVGEYDGNPRAQVLHWTLGGPWFPETVDCPMANTWFDEAAVMLRGHGEPCSA